MAAHWPGGLSIMVRVHASLPFLAEWGGIKGGEAEPNEDGMWEQKLKWTMLYSLKIPEYMINDDNW